MGDGPVARGIYRQDSRATTGDLQVFWSRLLATEINGGGVLSVAFKMVGGLSKKIEVSSPHQIFDDIEIQVTKEMARKLLSHPELRDGIDNPRPEAGFGGQCCRSAWHRS